MRVLLNIFSILHLIYAVKLKENTETDCNNINMGILPDRTNRVEDIYLRFYNGEESNPTNPGLKVESLPTATTGHDVPCKLQSETTGQILMKFSDNPYIDPADNPIRTSFEEYLDIPLHQACRLLEVKGFDNDNPSILYIHGFIETAQQESVQVMVNAYLEARPNTNIILLDWSNMSHGSYLVNAARNTKKVGAVASEYLSKLLDAGLSIDRLQVIGHSLGSHVAGYLARDLKNKYNKIIRRLTALDPAFPAFYPDGVVMDHVTEGDADFVDVIHTDAGGYGAPVRTGTADFWPNGGKRVQPGCPRFAPVPLSDDNLCSHWRSWRFYAESIRNPEAFPASPAESYNKFRENQTPEVGMVYMGANCDSNARGSYYLTTNAEYPFGKGMDGIYLKNKNKKNSNKTETNIVSK